MVKLDGKKEPKTIPELYSIIKEDLDGQMTEIKNDIEAIKEDNNTIKNLLNEILKEIKKRKRMKK